MSTPMQEYCPDVITAGFDRNIEMDNSLSIICVVTIIIILSLFYIMIIITVVIILISLL